MSSAPVAVIIPVYNGELFLGEAIESVLAQTRPPADVIVVDDGSDDGGMRIAASFGERIRVLRQPRGGVGAARNCGIQATAQPYVAFLDQDDLWLPGKLALQLAALEADRDLAIVFGHVEQFLSPHLAPDLARRLECDTRPQAAPYASSMLVRRQVFSKIGMFPVRTDAAFLDWYLRAAEVDSPTRMLPATLTLRRIHGGNQSYRNASLLRDYLRFIRASLERRRAATKHARSGPGA